MLRVGKISNYRLDWRNLAGDGAEDLAGDLAATPRLRQLNVS